MKYIVRVAELDSLIYGRYVMLGYYIILFIVYMNRDMEKNFVLQIRMTAYFYIVDLLNLSKSSV